MRPASRPCGRNAAHQFERPLSLPGVRQKLREGVDGFVFVEKQHQALRLKACFSSSSAGRFSAGLPDQLLNHAEGALVKYP